MLTRIRVSFAGFVRPLFLSKKAPGLRIKTHDCRVNDIECERLIDNNISNAIKYATPNKPISIALSKNKDTNRVILEFKSFGKPIKDVTRVFEKNYRENEAKRGLGLGLNMVKGICEKYNCLYNVTYLNGQNIFTYTFFGWVD